jgi:hypothetical protein
MRKIASLAMLMIMHAGLNAQERCATTEQNSPRRSPGEVTELTGTAQAGNSGSLPARITVPVVVHVLYRTDNENISDDQIRSQIESLNADLNRENGDFNAVPAVFAAKAGRTDIRFVLATADPAGRATNGIIRRKTSTVLWINDDRIKRSATGGSDAWDSRQYLNIWVGNTSSSLLGFSTFPGADAEKDGIVIRYDVFGTRGRVTSPWNKGRTLTHELGHWLGLRHIWGDSPCGDDGVEDTPRQRTGNRGIPVFPRLNTGCDNGPDGDMFMNFMDLSDDAALLMFTAGQASLMRSQFAVGGSRRSLLESRGAQQPWNLSAASAAGDPASAAPAQLQVYPNPVRSSFRVTGLEAPAGRSASFFILNASGRQVMSGSIKESSDTLDISSLPAGIYNFCVNGQVTRFVKS